MGYRRTLLLRWSHRDRLAVLAVAVTVAFLTGAVLLLFAAGAQTAGIAAEYDSPGSVTYYDSPDAASRAVADADGAVVLPVSEVMTGDGRATVVGVPSDDERTFGRRGRTIRGDTTGASLGTLETTRSVTMQGQDGSTTVDVSPRSAKASVLAPSWYIVDTGTVDELGPTGAYVLYPASTEGQSVSETPLLSALLFFLTGTRQALIVLGIVAGGAALLVAVTIYSVSRMTVRDRMPTLRIVRATGGAPWDVMGVFTTRAALVTGVGIALGYAIGVIVANAAVNLSVAIGLPTSLTVSVSGRVVRVLIPLFGCLFIIGGTAGAMAAWPAVSTPPARLTRIEVSPATGTNWPAIPGRVRALLTPELLDWRALWPTTATLTAFVAFVLLVSAMAGVAAPLATAEGAIVTEPDSRHPVGSQVQAAYADALAERGIDASGEILLFEMVNGTPVPARGAEFSAFRNVTDATVTDGEAPSPTATEEAIIGVDLAATLDVEVGDQLTLGGSTDAAFTRVHIVGMYEAPGPYDDQLLVSLPIARHLTTVGPDRVNLIRADRLPAVETNESIGVVDITVDGDNDGDGDTVAAGDSFDVRVTVQNDGLQQRQTTIQIRFGEQRNQLDVTVPAGQSRTRTVSFDAGSSGTYQLEAGDTVQDIQVVDPTAIRLVDVPMRAPSGSQPLVRVERVTGIPVSGATVHAGNATATTDEAGYARIPIRDAGTRMIRATAGNQSTARSITITPNATKQLTAQLRTRPSTPSLATRPEAQLRLFNPWNQSVDRTIHLIGPGGTTSYPVTLNPSERLELSRRLERQSPGTYAVTATADGRDIAATQYRVTGDERIISALASGGQTQSTGIGQAINVAFGNFQILLSALLLLAGVMTVGGTTATFAQAVHARRRTIGIHRSTGADPVAVLGLVLVDALRIGGVATLLATGLGSIALALLGQAGYLVVFGIRLTPRPSPSMLAAITVGGLVVTLAGALLATLALLAAPPAALLSDPAASERGFDE